MQDVQRHNEVNMAKCTASETDSRDFLRYLENMLCERLAIIPFTPDPRQSTATRGWTVEIDGVRVGDYYFSKYSGEGPEGLRRIDWYDGQIPGIDGMVHLESSETWISAKRKDNHSEIPFP